MTTVGTAILEHPRTSPWYRQLKSTCGGEKKMANPMSWDGINDPNHPHNWKSRRKWFVTIVASVFSFIAMMTSTMVAPALPQIAEDLRIESEAETQLILSAYVLAYAMGPFLWGPLSELYGRVIILQCASTWFFAWNLVCGFSRSKVSMIASRILSGTGCAASLTISNGILGDCWKPTQRGRSLSLYTIFPLLSPALGPVIGGFIIEKSTWRWSFWSTSAFDALVQVLAFVFLEETHAPTLLRGRTIKFQQSIGLAQSAPVQEIPKHDYRVVIKCLKTSLRRPFCLLFTQRPIQLLALINGITFGILYIVLSSLLSIFTTQYHQTTFLASLNYLSLGIGFAIGAQAFGPITDLIYRHRQQQTRDFPRESQNPAPLSQPSTVPTPQTASSSSSSSRLTFLFPAILISSIGLLILGWSTETQTQKRTSWIIPNLGILLFGAGNQFATQCVNAYIIDIYAPLDQSASAMAGIWAAKSLAGFGFPLFAPVMYCALGYGWAYSIFAVVNVTVAVLVCFGFDFGISKARCCCSKTRARTRTRSVGGES